jgi:hypothetical protein
VLVVLLAAAAAILCGVVVVAMGRGGELVLFAPDRRPLDPEILTAADVALLRPPAALWGYDRQATHVVLNMVAQTMTDRDVEIAALRRQLADLQSAAPQSQLRRPADTGAAGPLPAPLPPGRGGPRPAGDARSSSAWGRPSPAPMPDPGEQGERA